MLPVVRRISGSTCVFQQDSAPTHRIRNNVQLPYKLRRQKLDYVRFLYARVMLQLKFYARWCRIIAVESISEAVYGQWKPNTNTDTCRDEHGSKKSVSMFATSLCHVDPTGNRSALVPSFYWLVRVCVQLSVSTQNENYAVTVSTEMFRRVESNHHHLFSLPLGRQQSSAVSGQAVWDPFIGKQHTAEYIQFISVMSMGLALFLSVCRLLLFNATNSFADL